MGVKLGKTNVVVERKVCDMNSESIESSITMRGQVKSQVSENYKTGEKVNLTPIGTKFNIASQ